jgi:SAM-dependent methyltransferase
MTRLHLCCGGVYLQGYTNVDKYPFEAGDDSRSGCVADVMADVFELPFARGSVSEMVFVHGMEHFTRYDGVRLLGNLAELLSPEGVLYMEMPSRNPVLFLAAVERALSLLAPRRESNAFGKGPASSMLWGNQWAGFDYETHRYLWSTSELIEACRRSGLEHSAVFRLPASHVPFRDMGVAVSRSAAVRHYKPPTIRRTARAGAAGFGLGLARALAHVAAGVFAAPR